MSLGEEELLDYVFNQVNTLFPDNNFYDKKAFLPSLIESLKRLEKCFQYVTIPGYHMDENVFFHIYILINIHNFYIFLQILFGKTD